MRARKSRPYEESLKETLDDPNEAAAYLNAALEDGNPAVFLMALKDVADVYGGVAKIAQQARLNRENLYRMLSRSGNPTVASLNSVLNSLGLRLAISPRRARSTSRA